MIKIFSIGALFAVSQAEPSLIPANPSFHQAKELSQNKKFSKDSLDKIRAAYENRRHIKALFEEMTFFDEKEKHTLKKWALKEKKPIMMVVWTSSCGPCLNELPHVERLRKKMGDKMTILPIALHPPQGKKFDLPNITMPLFHSPSLINHLSKFGISSIPTTLFFTPNGFPLGVHSGFVNWDEKMAEIEKLIEEGKQFSFYDYNSAKAAP